MASPADAEAVSALLASLARDLNCLADADRSVRRSALERISPRLFGSGPDAPTPAVLQAVFVSALLAPAARLLADSVEKIRELSAALMAAALARLLDPLPLLPVLLPALAGRVGGIPVAEASEEIRLQLTQMLAEGPGSLIPRCGGAALSPYAAELTAVLVRMAGDAFHEIKKAACRGMAALAKALPPGALGAKHTPELLKSLVPALGHAHQKVRLAALAAFDALVAAGGLPAGTTRDLTLPAVKPLGGDKMPAVRGALYTAVAGWAQHALDRRVVAGAAPLEGAIGSQLAWAEAMALGAELLPLLMLGVSDDGAEQAAEAARLMVAVGRSYEEAVIAQQVSAGVENMAIDGAGAPSPKGGAANGATVADDAACPPEILPAALSGRDGRGARQLAADLLPSLLPPALRDVREWTVATRGQGARRLQTLLALAGPAATDRLESIVPALCGAVGDEDTTVASRLVLAAHTLGRSVSPTAWLPLVLEACVAEKATPGARASSLVVLAALLRATSGDRLSEADVAQLAAAVGREELRGCDAAPVRAQLLSVVTNLVSAAGSRVGPVTRPLFHTLLQLQAQQDEPALAARASEAIQALASAAGAASPAALFEAHAGPLLESLAASQAEWSGGSAGRYVLAALLKGSPRRVLEAHSAQVVALLAACAEPERDPPLRIAALQLTDALCEDTERGPAWSEPGVAAGLLSQVLLPSMVWRAGKTAAAVRYSAVVALGTFLRRKLCPPPVAAAALADGALLPPLTACLEEDWYAETRAAAAHATEQLLWLAGGHLSDEHKRAVYPELHKRLDDSNNAIRIAAAACFRAFFGTMGDYDETNTGYAVAGLLIHMDDADAAVQEAVCAAMEAAAKAKPAVVAAAVRAAKSKHREPRWCDRVLAACGGA